MNSRSVGMRTPKATSASSESVRVESNCAARRRCTSVAGVLRIAAPFLLGQLVGEQTREQLAGGAEVERPGASELSALRGVERKELAELLAGHELRAVVALDAGLGDDAVISSASGADLVGAVDRGCLLDLLAGDGQVALQLAERDRCAPARVLDRPGADLAEREALDEQGPHLVDAARDLGLGRPSHNAPPFRQ